MRAGIYDKYNTREGEREKWNFPDIFLPLTLKPGDFGKITSTSHNKTFNSQNHKFKRAIYSNMFRRNKSLLAGLMYSSSPNSGIYYEQLKK